MLAAWAGALAPGVGHAQEASVELARIEFLREAEEAARRGEHARALELARRGAALRMTPSVAHFLAREYEVLEQPLEALAQATACVRGAEVDRALRNRDALLQACGALVERATARVGRVVVRVADPLPPGLSLRVAGVPLPPTLLGVPYVVAPGAVRVEAEASGCEPALRTVTVEAGHVETVELRLPALRPAPEPLPVVVAPVVVAPVVVPPVVVPRVPTVAPPARRRWVAVGVGVSFLAVGSLVVSGIAYALANDARDARDTVCPPPCMTDDPDYAAAVGYDAGYRDYLRLTTGTLIAGASLTAGAALWWWLARPSGPRVVPTASVRGAVGVGLTGTW